MQTADTQPRVWVALHLEGTQTYVAGLRSLDSNSPHVWNLFGGRVEPGESYFKAAARELHEETGLSVKFKPKHIRMVTFVKSRLCVWLEKTISSKDLRSAIFTPEIADYEFADCSWLVDDNLHYSLRLFLKNKQLARI